MSAIDLNQIDIERQLLALDRHDCEESLYVFLRAAWKYIDPAPWEEGWATEAVCAHLEAVARGEVRRLCINIPPRIGKSNCASVAFPAWVWAQSRVGPNSGPQVRFIYASYAESLALRDSVKTRRLIESSWYQKLWGDRFSLMVDQNTKHRFGTDKGGERLITSIGGSIVGEGADIFCVDDANSPKEILSKATIDATNGWWDGSASSRLNNMRTGAFINIQQRVGEDDLTGHILAKNTGEWDHCCLPMRYEADRRCTTSIGWEDPREEEGELLWPERFGEAEVEALEKSMGQFIAAGQLQQRPKPQEGGIIKDHWWRLWAEEEGPLLDYVLGYLDTAYTTNTLNDYSAMTVWGVFTTSKKARANGIEYRANRILDRDGIAREIENTYSENATKVILLFAWQERLELGPLVEKITSVAKWMKIDRVIVENKASGISVAQEIKRLHRDEMFGVQLADPKSTDKVSRLYSVQHLFQEGIVFAPDKTWSQMVIDQVGMFPHGKHDDLVDTVSGALRHLRDTGILVRAPERIAQMEEAKRYTSPSENRPLYPS